MHLVMWRDKAAVNRVRMLWRFDSFHPDQFGYLAQLVEHSPDKREVTGSRFVRQCKRTPVVTTNLGTIMDYMVSISFCRFQESHWGYRWLGLKRHALGFYKFELRVEFIDYRG